MAKKKNKSQIVGESSDGIIQPSPSPGPAAAASTAKAKDAKPPQPSTSALIICRNKYVLH
jgi:hypothetical protein